MKIALLLVLSCVAACEKASPHQPRLFTNDELAALEIRVLAEVNKSTPDCIRREAVALWKPTGELAACLKECDVMDSLRGNCSVTTSTDWLPPWTS